MPTLRSQSQKALNSLSSNPTVSSSALSELLDKLEEVSIAGGLDLLHLAIEGGSAHALGLVDGIADAALCYETTPALEYLTDDAVIGALALWSPPRKVVPSQEVGPVNLRVFG